MNSNEEGLLNIDIVPNEWVTVNDNLLMTIYPFPPYDDKTCKMLHNMVEKSSTPPKDWPQWQVDIKGGAGNFDIFYLRFNLTPFK